jgi:hypothetical protein
MIPLLIISIGSIVTSYAILEYVLPLGGIGIPFSWLIPIIVAAITGWFSFCWYWYDVSHLGPEGIVFATARRKKLPVLKINDATGRGAYVVGEKRNDKDIYFKKSKKCPSMMIDPKILTNAPKDCTHDGVPVYHYSTNYAIPEGQNAILAWNTIIEYVRENYNSKNENGKPDLSFLDDPSIIGLVGVDKDDLVHDCHQYIKMHNPPLDPIPEEEIPKDDYITVIRPDGTQLRQPKYDPRAYTLAKAISEIQEKMMVIPIKRGYYSYAEGFQKSSIGYQAHDTEQGFILEAAKVRNELLSQEKLLTYGVILGGLAICGALAFAIISSI